MKNAHIDVCPFCGEAGKMLMHSEGVRYKVTCSSGGSCLGTMIYKWFDTPEEAAEAWNTRSNK